MPMPEGYSLNEEKAYRMIFIDEANKKSGWQEIWKAKMNFLLSYRRTHTPVASRRIINNFAARMGDVSMTSGLTEMGTNDVSRWAAF